MSPGRLPLFVDLDGSLIRTDLLWESFALAVRRSPSTFLKAVIWWLRGGRSRLKGELARRVDASLDVQTLPFVEGLLAWLRAERAAGTPLVLATASHRLLAERVAAHVGVFDAVLATDAENLKGAAKLRAIRQYLQQNGLGEAFRYVGDSRADRPLFAASCGYVVVGARTFRGLPPPQRVFDAERGTVAHLVRLLRPHQWSKNLLIFAPVVAGQKVLDPTAMALAGAGVVVFSLIASACYIINDVLDATADRAHPRKRNRPLARGDVSPARAVVMASGLLVAAGVLAWLALPLSFCLLAMTYFAFATAYSLDLKRRVLVDVLVLAAMYTLRILAGGAATGIVVSPWLLAFSMFVFLSLAFVKRYIELVGSAGGEPSVRQAGRGYVVSDVDLIRSAGPAAGYVATLVLALFVASPEIATRYSSPEYLYALCPLALYWLTRIWFLAHRRQLHDDPVVFALRDGNSYVVLLLGALVMMAAKLI